MGIIGKGISQEHNDEEKIQTVYQMVPTLIEIKAQSSH